jgi:type I restriction enzyme S subunit
MGCKQVNDPRWISAKLSDVASFQEGPGILAVDFCQTGVPLVRLAGLGGHQVTLQGCDFLHPSKVEKKWSHFRLRLGDILISTSASFGRPAVVGPEADGAVFYTGLIRFRSTSPSLNEGYLKTFLGSREFLLQAEALASGSVIKHFGPSHLRQMSILLPPIRVQERVAAMHAALDDKIELNRKMNETLEATTRALFRDWFVDFGPIQNVHSNQEPYLPSNILDLFPHRLDHEGNPVGWHVESVYDQANWINGAAYKDMHFSSEPDALPVVKIAELKNGITRTTRYTNTDLGDRYRISDGELLFSWSGNPDTSIDTFIWTMGDAWLNQHIFAVRANGKRSQVFLYTMLKMLRTTFAEIARNKQTTGLGHVTQQDLIRLKIVTPSEPIQAAFEKIAGPIHERLISNLFDIQYLIKVRDFLLPKLMVGEAHFKDMERVVGEAV